MKKPKSNSKNQVDWAFDCKDSTYNANTKEEQKKTGGQIATNSKVGFSSKKQEELDSKFGNFNTPIIMKLCSKYNKSVNQADNSQKVNPIEIANIVVQHLNMILKHDYDNNSNQSDNKIVSRVKSTDLQRWNLIFSEISTFSQLNGFINIHFANP